MASSPPQPQPASESKALQLAKDAQYKCAVCMEPFAAPVTITCGHTYCRYCIGIVVLQEAANSRTAQEKGNRGGAAAEEGGPRCPMCREKMTGQLRECKKIDEAMVAAKAWGNDARVFCAKVATAYDNDTDKTLSHSARLRLIFEDGSVSGDVMWARADGTPRRDTVSRIAGTWDHKTGAFSAKAYATTWQTDLNKQWARYKPQHVKGQFRSMGYGETQEKKNTWESWTGKLVKRAEGEEGCWVLTDGAFKIEDSNSNRQSGGVLMMMVEEDGKEKLEAHYDKYIRDNAPKKQEKSFLSSFLAAPSKTKKKSSAGGGGLAFRNLWAHSSPDPSAFQGETVKRGTATSGAAAAAASSRS
uniref:RING-type domain-containing protein n=1 Tax=Lotharella globosa TaxID=91324 RepID=A0A7S4DXC8_9EUKA|mmetsp:Transcript_8787/g.17137  ORF Transcript_8787/g.17137 Transcript_8787/m.17137 type:complete len:358 (+) Transcript_8787:64-1137(+)